MYVKPSEFYEMRKYAEDYMPHWVIPLDLTFRSMLRSFETGLAREDKQKRVVPLRIYGIDRTRSMIEFLGKFGMKRSVEVPFSEKQMDFWYHERAKDYKKESFRRWIRQKWGYGTHDGRRTGIINFLILHGSVVDSRLEIISRTGHNSLDELMPYVREYTTVKRILNDTELQLMKKMMEHIKLE